MRRWIQITIAAFALALPATVRAAPAPTVVDWPEHWQNVAVGGGGAVLGVYADRSVPGLFYMRTDVGGAYRWDNARSRWVPITERMGPNDFGIESLAVDPTQPRRVYLETGKYPWQPAQIYKSSDAGDSWTALHAPPKLLAHSNGPLRIAGERLAVDPNRPGRLLLASRNIGPWKTDDDGVHWTPIDLGVAGSASAEMTFVAFDRGSGKPGAATPIVYLGVFAPGSKEGGVWKSADAGATWTHLPGGLDTPARGEVATDGTLFVTYFAPPAPKEKEGGPKPASADAPSGGVAFARRDDAKLTDCTPMEHRGYCALACDPTDPRVVLVVESRLVYSCHVFRSTDAGRHWTDVKQRHGEGNEATRDVTSWVGNVSQIVIDPANPRQALLADWIGVLRTRDVSAPIVTWDCLSAGHEEIVPLALRSAPEGAPLLSADADVNGERHERLDAFPERSFIHASVPVVYGSTVSLDFCESKPDCWARAFQDFAWSGMGFSSSDDGKSWRAFATTPAPGARAGRIAVSASSPENIVWAPSRTPVHFTRDGGKTWAEAKGLPAESKGIDGEFTQQANNLASDRVAGGVFYLYCNVAKGAGAVYRSDDGGEHWAKIFAVEYHNRRDRIWQYKLASAPGVRGEVWLDLGYDGVYRSRNADADPGSVRFDLAPGLSSAGMIAFGKAAPGRSNPAVILAGQVGGEDGIFLSDDDGANWKRISNPKEPVNDAPSTIEGDRQTYGRVYVGTDGRGIYYSTPAGN